MAPLLPLAFWLEARDACAAVNPNTIWIAETVESDFINTIRRRGYECLTDMETLRAFDVSYEYDTYPEWVRFLNGKIGLEAYRDRLRVQESILGDTDLKLRYLENHDQRRAADLLGRDSILRQWTAFSLFSKGTALIYAGQEYAIAEKPDLFGPDPVDWRAGKTPEGRNHFKFLKTLINQKKSGIVRDGFYWLPEAPEGCILAAYERRSPDGRLTGLRVGLFNVEGRTDGRVYCPDIWPELGTDAVFSDLLNGNRRISGGGILEAGSEPLIMDWGLTS